MDNNPLATQPPIPKPSRAPFIYSLLTSAITVLTIIYIIFSALSISNASVVPGITIFILWGELILPCIFIIIFSEASIHLRLKNTKHHIPTQFAKVSTVLSYIVLILSAAIIVLPPFTFITAALIAGQQGSN